MVLHPFGRDLKTNMHVHILMTEGGLISGGDWVEMPYDALYRLQHYPEEMAV